MESMWGSIYGGAYSVEYYWEYIVENVLFRGSVQNISGYVL